MLLQGHQRSVGFGLGDKGADPAFMVDHHGQLAIQPAAAQALFNLPGVDPKTADLYLVVATPTQHNPCGAPLRQVAAAVGPQPLAARHQQFDERAVSLPRRIHIPQAHSGPDDVQLAHHLFIHRLQIVIEDQHLAIGDGVADITIIVIGGERPVRNQYRGFGGAIEVVQLAPSRQPLDYMGFAGIATGEQMRHGQGGIRRQDIEQRRRQEGMSDALSAEQFHQLPRVASLLLTGYDQLGAGNQGGEDFDQ